VDGVICHATILLTGLGQMEFSIFTVYIAEKKRSQETFNIGSPTEILVPYDPTPSTLQEKARVSHALNPKK